MWVKSAITVCLYTAIFNVYIWLLTVSTHYAHLLYNLLTISALLFYYFNKDTKHGLCKQIIDLFFFCIIGNFIVIFLYWMGVLPGQKQMFYMFNGLIFVNTIIIFTSMKRHGLTKD